MNKRSLNAQIATILRKKDISNLNLQIEANRKKGFSLSLELGKLIHTIHDGMSKANFSDFVAKALSDYESESDKKAISDGLKEVRENFFGRGDKNTPWEYFGMGKSWYYRVKKSAMHSSELVEKFPKGPSRRRARVRRTLPRRRRLRLLLRSRRVPLLRRGVRRSFTTLPSGQIGFQPI
jgi:uncharacterized protein YeeX (DUF496 family)